MRVRTSEKVISYIVLILALLVSLGPVLWIAFDSLKPPGLVMVRPPALRFAPSLENYKNVFTSAIRGHFFPRFILNSLITAGVSTILAVVFGTMAGYALARFRFRRKENLLLFILSTRMFPPAAIMVPVFGMMMTFNLLDTYPGLILPYTAFNLPFVVWLMRGFLGDIPEAIEEAALVDGASRLGALWKVLLPLAAPGLVATTIFCFVLSWNEFLFALVLTRTQVRTAPVEIAQFVSMYGVSWGEMFAAATLMTLPVMAMAFIVWRHIVRGLMFGAVEH